MDTNYQESVKELLHMKGGIAMEDTIQREEVIDREKDISYLEIYDITTRTIETVCRFDYLIEAPNWSQDGRSLYYNSKGNIYRYDLETKCSTQLEIGFATRCNNDHVLSPCGKYMGISHEAKEDGQPHIYIIPIQGGNPTLITAIGPSYLHGWSNDGKTLVYTGIRNGEADIYAILAVGGEEKQLTFTPNLNDGSEYDWKDEYIWYNSVQTGLMQVWKMRPDGSDQRQITYDENWNTWFPHVAPDHSKVVTISYKKEDIDPQDHPPHKNVEIRMMNLDGTNQEVLVQLFGGQGTINVNSWAPCSTKFAYVRYELPKTESR
ncbi:MAG: hypothetical protein R3Y54_12035 [Eubacteriales bacterium]